MKRIVPVVHAHDLRLDRATEVPGRHRSPSALGDARRGAGRTRHAATTKRATASSHGSVLDPRPQEFARAHAERARVPLPTSRRHLTSASARAISIAYSGLPPDDVVDALARPAAKGRPRAARAARRWSSPELKPPSSRRHTSSRSPVTPSACMTRLARRSATRSSCRRRPAYARTAADDGSSHWTSSTTTRSGRSSARARSAERNPTPSVRSSVGSALSSRRSAALSARACGLGNSAEDVVENRLEEIAQTGEREVRLRGYGARDERRETPLPRRLDRTRAQRRSFRSPLPPRRGPRPGAHPGSGAPQCPRARSRAR